MIFPFMNCYTILALSSIHIQLCKIHRIQLRKNMNIMPIVVTKVVLYALKIESLRCSFGQNPRAFSNHTQFKWLKEKRNYNNKNADKNMWNMKPWNDTISQFPTLNPSIQNGWMEIEWGKNTNSLGKDSLLWNLCSALSICLQHINPCGYATQKPIVKPLTW